MTGCIAVLNAGSSSIKFALYESGHDGALLFRGQIENIGQTPHLKAVEDVRATTKDRDGLSPSPRGRIMCRGPESATGIKEDGELPRPPRRRVGAMASGQVAPSSSMNIN